MSKSGMTPAALGALLDGDLGNYLVAVTPGGIEAQEARGQQDFITTETLPKECNSRTTREQLEQMGIVFGEDADDLFVNVRLPAGWKKVPTSHSMWSKLVDEQGRERAAIFYKAAFYDRSAHITLVHRFSYTIQPLCGHDADYDWNTEPRVGIVTDCDKEIWRTDAIAPSEELKGFMIRDILSGACKEWLDERYPDWMNTLSYWTEEE